MGVYGIAIEAIMQCYILDQKIRIDSVNDDGVGNMQDDYASDDPKYRQRGRKNKAIRDIMRDGSNGGNYGPAS